MLSRMRPDVQPREQPDELEEPEPNDAPAVGYRVAGDLEIRSAELRQELGEARAQIKSLERELWATRKDLRKEKMKLKAALAARGGGGATVGSLAAFLLYGFGLVTSPPILLSLVVIGFVIGAILAPRAANEDDDFPPAPPPRLR